MYNVITVFFNDSHNKQLALSELIGQIHNFNYKNEDRVALTFNKDAVVGDWSSLVCLGLIGGIDALTKFKTKAKLELTELDDVRQIEADSFAYLRSKRGIGLKGNLNQLKKRAKNLEEKHNESTALERMLQRAKQLENEANFFHCHQYSKQAKQHINLHIVSDDVSGKQARKPDIYGLKSIVPLI